MGNEDNTSSSNLLNEISVGDLVISVPISKDKKIVNWQLPPSKSHAIRTLILASQSDDITTISGIANSGEDVNSMKNCLIQLGVTINDLDSDGQIINTEDGIKSNEIPSFRVHGVGRNGFSRPKDKLNVGNSGTTLRLIAMLCSRFPFTVLIDGDETLRSRDTQVLWNSIEQSGVNISFLDKSNRLPVKMTGPWFSKPIDKIQLDVSKSSQPLSAWILASSGLEQEVDIERFGTPVSNRHWELSYQMCKQSGSKIELNGPIIKLSPWKVNLPEEVEVPKDASMASFAMLASLCLGYEINLIGWPGKEDSIGHEILEVISSKLGLSWKDGIIKTHYKHSSIEVDITNSNDLITPLSIMMAISGGGIISGASHTSFKESNRLISTQSLLHCFGMSCTITEDGLSIPGGQSPKSPKEIVDSYGDHRIFMSAFILASKVGAEIRGEGLHMIADELFIERL